MLTSSPYYFKPLLLVSIEKEKWAFKVTNVEQLQELQNLIKLFRLALSFRKQKILLPFPVTLLYLLFHFLRMLVVNNNIDSIAPLTVSNPTT